MDATRGVRIVSIAADDPVGAASAIFDRLGTDDLAGVLLFCTSRIDLSAVANVVSRQRKGLVVAGCTTAGEITPEGARAGTITAIGFPASDFAMQAKRFHNATSFDVFGAQREIAMLASDVATKSESLGPKLQRVGILLVDGLSRREELIAHTIQHILGSISVIGGSAGDDLAFEKTWLLCDGAFATDCAVLLLLASTRTLSVFRSDHHFDTPTLAVVTAAEPAARRVQQLNGARAATEFAALIGVGEGELTTEMLARHPLMVRVGGDYYARAVQSVDAEGALVFQSAIENGLVLRVGNCIDPTGRLSRRLAEHVERVGEPEAVIAFESVQNRLEVDALGAGDARDALYARFRFIGFHGYGEQFRDVHVNRCLVGLVIGAS